MPSSLGIEEIDEREARAREKSNLSDFNFVRGDMEERLVDETRLTIRAKALTALTQTLTLRRHET